MRTVCGGQGGLLSWLGTEEQWSGDICGALLGSPTELGHGVTPELAGKSLHLGALVSDIVAWSVRSTGVSSPPLPMPSWQRHSLPMGQGQNQAHKLGASAVTSQTGPWRPCVERGNSVGAERTHTGVREGTWDRASRSGCRQAWLWAPGLSSESRWFSLAVSRKAGAAAMWTCRRRLWPDLGGQSPGTSIRWSLETC